MTTKIIEGTEYIVEEIEGRGLCLIPKDKPIFSFRNIYPGKKIKCTKHKRGNLYCMVAVNQFGNYTYYGIVDNKNNQLFCLEDNGNRINFLKLSEFIEYLNKRDKNSCHWVEA
jgi:hypothetical protein